MKLTVQAHVFLQWKRIERLNLESVVAALTMWRGMSAEEAEHAATEYRRFLMLCALHSNETLVPPCAQAAAAWDAHVLDTDKYADDGLAVFGSFLHHFPHVVETRWQQYYMRTIRIYRVVFGGEPEIAAAAPHVHLCAAMRAPRTIECGGGLQASLEWARPN